MRDMGGQITAMDTDSAMIVSTKSGGLVPCAGGPHKLANYQARSGSTAIRALSFAEVDSIRERFEPLNPWRKTLKTPFLKLEKENFDANGNRQQLTFYGISAKLYCLFNLEGNRLLVRKPSGHGLGFLQALYTIADWQRRTGRKWKDDLPPWIFEAWHFILSRELGLPHRPPAWLKQSAVMAVPITTPQVLSRLGAFKDDLRPFTVVTVPLPKRETVRDPLWKGYFIMPHTENLNDLHGRTMVNIVSGETSTFTIRIRRDCRSLWAGCLSRRWKMKSITSCRERKPSSALPTAAYARVGRSAGLRAGMSSRVNFITSAKRHLRAGRAGSIFQ